MGRTVMPFSHLLEKEHGKWKEFRKCLSKENQEAFDRLFDRAKFHTAAGSLHVASLCRWKQFSFPSAWNTKK